MPFYSNSTEQVGGFMKLWLGSLGSTVFSLILLLFSLSFHFSLKPYHSLFVWLNLNKLFSQKKSSADEIETKNKLNEEVDITSSPKKIKKKWKFPWTNDESEDDFLFRDVSQNKAKERIKDTKPKIISNTSKKIRPPCSL